MKTVLIFDYDGVIVDSLDMFMTFFIQACKENGWDEISTKQDFLALFTGNMFENMMKLGMSRQDILSIVLKVKENLTNHLNELPLFPTIKETLEDLSKQNTLIISTSNDTTVVEKFLTLNKLTCFTKVYGSDLHHSKIKKIEMIKECYPAEHYIYIGDTIGDIIEGKKANIQTIGVTWGWHTKDQILSSKPDYLAESIQDLVIISNNLN